jgi:hypothetical protein
MQMSELKSSQAKMSIRRETYERLSAVAKANHVTMSALIEDMMVHIQPDSASTADQRLIRMEAYLKDIYLYVREAHDLATSIDQALVKALSEHDNQLGLRYETLVSREIRKQEGERMLDEARERNDKEYRNWLNRVRSGEAGAFNTFNPSADRKLSPQEQRIQDQLNVISNAEERERVDSGFYKEHVQAFKDALKAGDVDRNDYIDVDKALAAGVVPKRKRHTPGEIGSILPKIAENDIPKAVVSGTGKKNKRIRSRNSKTEIESLPETNGL